MASGTIIELQLCANPNVTARTTDLSMVHTLPFVRRFDVDAGYVTKAQRFSIWAWNGHDTSETIAEEVLTGDTEGITVDTALPAEITAKTAQRIDVTITPDGPVIFETYIDFDGPEDDPAVYIVGTRAPQLSGDVGYLLMPHNWTDGLDESLGWKTEVLTAIDRTEQRIQLRTMPRRSWELRLLVSGAARRKLETWLGHRMKRYLFMPVWRDLTKTIGAVAVDSSTIPVQTEYLEFATDRKVAIFDAWDNSEIRTITGVGPGFVAVDAPFEQNWPAGSMVAPCRYGLALSTRRLSRFTEEVADYRLTFEALNEYLMPAVESPELYRDVMVCPLTPSWDGNGEEEIDNSWLRLDNTTGLVEFEINSIEPIFRRDVPFLLIGRDKIDTFLRFLFACAGRLAPFWLSSTAREFEMVMPAAMDDTEILIENIDYEFSLSGSPARSHIELITTDGVVIRRMITGVETQSDGTEKLILDSGLPQNISAATLNRCAWLELVRLDSDDIDLHWISWECMQVTVPIVVLP